MHGFRLAYLIGDEGTVDVLLVLLDRLDVVQQNLKTRYGRHDYIFVDFAAQTALRKGSAEQRQRLEALIIARLGSEQDRVLRERWARHAHALLDRDDLTADGRSALVTALGEPR